MRNTFLLLSFLFVGCVGAIAQNKTLGVGTGTPNPNAALHVESPTNNQGFIMPRLTTTQRLSMTLTPSDMGLMVYDITKTNVYTWDGLVWNEAGDMEYPIVDTVTSAPNNSNLLKILYTGAGNVGVAQFSNLSPTNNFQPLFVTNAGTNGAGYFQVTNTASASPGLRSLTNTNQPGAHAFLGRTTGTGASAGYFEIVNGTNANPALYATTNGTGGLNATAILGETATGFSAIIGRATGGAANGVSGISTDPGAGSFAILGSVSATGGGQAGVFTISNTANANNTLEATTSGTGGGAFIKVMNAASTKPALWAETNSNQPLSAPIFGLNTGTGDVAASFRINNAASTFPALYAETSGTGRGATIRKTNTGGSQPGLFVSTEGGRGIWADHNGATGEAGIFQNINVANTAPALFAEAVGPGASIWANKDAGESGPALDVTHQGTTGAAGLFTNMNPANLSPALSANSSSAAAAFYSQNTGSGNGFAGFFQNTNSSNTFPAIQIQIAGNGSSAMYINHTGTGGNFVTYTNSDVPAARIDKTGKGFFNGGTQSSGADVAELFDVEGDRNQYEPGDVLIISEITDRTIEKSNTPNSTKVAGVYATKPGVILTERDLEANTDDLVPMGVVGVIPTKVCLENGPIKRGDLLVTSSTKGHAMKAKPVVINGVEIYPTGAILGKALENFESGDKGLINVLVNVK